MKGSQILDILRISERLREVKDRTIPGNWEENLIMGAENQSAIATLVEPRYVMLLPLKIKMHIENL